LLAGDFRSGFRHHLLLAPALLVLRAAQAADQLGVLLLDEAEGVVVVRCSGRQRDAERLHQGRDHVLAEQGVGLLAVVRGGTLAAQFVEFHELVSGERANSFVHDLLPCLRCCVVCSVCIIADWDSSVYRYYILLLLRDQLGILLHRHAPAAEHAQGHGGAVPRDQFIARQLALQELPQGCILRGLPEHFEQLEVGLCSDAHCVFLVAMFLV